MFSNGIKYGFHKKLLKNVKMGKSLSWKPKGEFKGSFKIQTRNQIKKWVLGEQNK